jgi:hypothetical protein
MASSPAREHGIEERLMVKFLNLIFYGSDQLHTQAPTTVSSELFYSGRLLTNLKLKICFMPFLLYFGLPQVTEGFAFSALI